VSTTRADLVYFVPYFLFFCSTSGAIVEELAAEGAVQGTLKGGGTAWTPAVYSRTQQDAVLSFYRRGWSGVKQKNCDSS